MNPDPLAHAANRETLTTDGTPVLWWSRADTQLEGRPRAEGGIRPAGVHVADCAETVLHELSGWVLSTEDEELVHALEGHRARVLRSTLSMSLTLVDEPALRGVPDRISLGPLNAKALAEQADEIATVAFRAHGSDTRWTDQPGAVAWMRRTADGEVLGPMLDSSVLATRGDVIVGACLITDRAGDPPHGGPCVLDIFRDPDDPAPGVGGAMLAHATRSLRSVGLAALSLVISADNEPAIALFRSLGFAELGRSWTVELP